ncbi:MAG: urease accessory protein [Devosia sp.]|uniref:HupE/UreJ family protein n=1 Tax=Devosia sp. TaxID=1871048 RepID=UPI0026105E5C|nr:HupE/UreJ family protein [Devosia sp.]MDB5529925.1 urease accessory protein [Devosia sp.]
MRRLPIIIAALLVPTAAFAHPDISHAAGLLSGFEHPLGGIDHVLAMMAVGVFAFVLGGRALFVVPLSFVGMMTAGFLLGAGGVELPFVELAIGLSSVIIGGAAALSRPMSTAGAAALVGVFAIFHGHAHGAEMPANAGGVLYAAGFVAATALLHVVGIGAAGGSSKLVGKFDGLVARIAGGSFAVGGVGVLLGWI